MSFMDFLKEEFGECRKGSLEAPADFRPCELFTGYYGKY